MEYLMTYSWAILIVLVVGLALWQMGVFKTGQELPTRTGWVNLQPIPSAIAYSSSTGTFSVSLINTVGTPIRINNVNMTDQYQPATTCNNIMIDGVVFTPPVTVSKGDAFKVSGNCGTRQAQDRFNMNINIDYTVVLDNKETARTENGFIEGPVE